MHHLNSKKGRKGKKNNRKKGKDKQHAQPVAGDPRYQQHQQPLVFRRLTDDGNGFNETLVNPFQQHQQKPPQQHQYYSHNAGQMLPPSSKPSRGNANQPVPGEDGSHFPLEGTMANERDPFWIRRRFTREDSFPEIKELNAAGIGSRRPVNDVRESIQSSYNSTSHRQQRRNKQQEYPGKRMEAMNPAFGSSYGHNHTAPRLKAKPLDSGNFHPRGAMSPISSQQPYREDPGRPSFSSNLPQQQNYPAAQSYGQAGHPGSHTMQKQMEPRPSADGSDMAILMSSNYASTPRGQVAQSRAYQLQSPISNYRQASHTHANHPSNLMRQQPTMIQQPPPITQQPQQQARAPNFNNPYDNITRPLSPSNGAPASGPPPPPPKIRSQRPNPNSY